MGNRNYNTQVTNSHEPMIPQPVIVPVVPTTPAPMMELDPDAVAPTPLPGQVYVRGHMRGVGVSRRNI